MNLLITGAWSNANEYFENIKQLGHNIVFMQFESEELPCSYEWVEGIIGNGIFLSHSIEKFINLKYIQLTSAGFDRVPMDYVKNHDIQIYNARGVYSIPMAEYAMMGVLDLYKKMNFFREKKQKHLWEKNREVLELYNKRVCIIGCGNVGIECAKRFHAFGCEVIGVDVFVRPEKYFSKIFDIDNLENILPKVDIIILTLPLTKDTKHLMNEQRIKLVKDGSIIVNIGRGAVLDENALLNHIERLQGAVLDVFEAEPLDVSSPLWEKDNILITPHNCYVGENNQKRLADVIIKNLE